MCVKPLILYLENIVCLNLIISLNFQPVSICKNLIGTLKGKKLFLNRCKRTDESLPIEYKTTGFSDTEKVSLITEIASSSRCCKCFFNFDFYCNIKEILHL